MASYFVDTNVFLRYLTNDLPAQAEAISRLWKRAAAGEIELQTSALVLAELVWTLESYYELSREAVKAHVLAILNTPGLIVEHADWIGQAILLYAQQKVDFIDAYHVFWMQSQGLDRAYTLDTKHFGRAKGMMPRIPGGQGGAR